MFISDLACGYTRRNWKRKPEARALPQFGSDADTSAHLFDNALAQRKAEARTLYETVYFHKAVENCRLILSRDTDAGIFYKHFKLPGGIDLVTDGDSAPVRKLNRIAHEIGYHLFLVSAVGVEPGIER